MNKKWGILVIVIGMIFVSTTVDQTYSEETEKTPSPSEIKSFSSNSLITQTSSTKINPEDPNNIKIEIMPENYVYKKYSKISSELIKKINLKLIESNLDEFSIQKTQTDSEILTQMNNTHKYLQTSNIEIKTLPVYVSLNGLHSPSLLPGYAQIESVNEKMIKATVPITKLYELSQNSNVIFVKSPNYFQPAAITSEGVEILNADFAHSLGTTGDGINVGVIDSGFNLTSSEISSNIVKSHAFSGDITGGSGASRNHGTALAEIIVDMAPDVDLYLYQIADETHFTSAISMAINDGVQVINLSGGFPTSPGIGPLFRDGTSVPATQTSIAFGFDILPVVSAGNEADRHWKGDFVDSGVTFSGKPAHNFRPNESGVQKACLPISVDQGDAIFITWNDWPASDQDYDLFLYDSSLGNVIDDSTNLQSGTEDPSETIDTSGLTLSDPSYCIVLIEFSASTTNSFHFNLIPGSSPGPVILDGRGVASGSISTPADSPEALAVGSVDSIVDELRFFSSRGPTDDDRAKPEICGTSIVTTEAIPNFDGTSAASPHITGLAALILEDNPSFDVSTLYDKILDDARPIEDSGDNLCGVGLGLYPEISGSCKLPGDVNDWRIVKDCILGVGSFTIGKNIIITNSSGVTVPSGATIDMDFENQHLLIKNGSKIIIKSGGKIT